MDEKCRKYIATIHLLTNLISLKKKNKNLLHISYCYNQWPRDIFYQLIGKEKVIQNFLNVQKYLYQKHNFVIDKHSIAPLQTRSQNINPRCEVMHWCSEQLMFRTGRLMTYTFLLYNTGGVRHAEVIKENQQGKLMKKLFPYSVSNCNYKNLLF